MSTAPIKFYYDLMSQPCRALYIFMKKSQIPFDDFPIALRKGIHLTDEFKNEINRFQKVPAIVDDKYKLSESIAIFRYLCDKYKIKDHWYPENQREIKGRIDEYLEWQHVNTRMTCTHYFILKYLKPRVLGRSSPQQQQHQSAIRGSSIDDLQIIASAQKQMEKILDQIENLWLNSNEKFIAGNDVTIADLFGACELEQSRIAGYEPGDGRPKIAAWLQAVKEQTNPYYDEAHAIPYKLAAEPPP